ncbi:Gfo/Idh/MocA family protein [Leifsonia sp. NPDC058230]|uniref:Gfo/Idh/MocA family protein n=1 Tax=Leifsonia sp. NPDC058230 TaxID=3346391 RepID=UPI0036D7F74A
MTERPENRHTAHSPLASAETLEQRIPLGVGIVGAGPVTQAIHLPTLAKLGDRFRVTHVMDVAPALAEQVGLRAGASWSTTLEDLLADPSVDVVAICSPPEYHVSQVIAACRAGKRAVLCEKPFALSVEDALDAIAASAEFGVPLLVGAMHSFDSAWLAARAAWARSGSVAHTIRSSIVLPPNSRFEDLATELVGRAAPLADSATASPTSPADLLRDAVLGVAVHDLPLIRTFLVDPDALRVLSASFESPFGYLIVLGDGTTTIELRAAFTDTWKPDWRLEAFADDVSLCLSFPPSYVQAGSSVAELRSPSGVEVFGPWPANGYEDEWRHVADLADGGTPAQSLDTIGGDIAFALRVADESAALLDAPRLVVAS